MADITPWGTNVSTGDSRFGRRVNLGATDNLTAGVTGNILILSSTGAFGVSGLTGATGLQGLQGQTGIAQPGATGLQGITGTAVHGATGLAGETGLIGFTGVTVQGATGLIGFDGITGLSFSGSTGISGFTGIIGITGISAVTGSTGTQGTTGGAVAGSQGLQGSTGLLGAAGLQGSTGIAIQGSTGLSGNTFTQGVTGLFPYQNLFTQQQGSGVTGLYQIPGGTVSADEQQLEFTAWGITASGSLTTINVVFDGYTVFSQSVTTTPGTTFMLRGWLIRVAASVEELVVEAIFNNQVSCAVQRFPANVSLSTSQNLVVYLDSAGAGHALNGLIVNHAS